MAKSKSEMKKQLSVVTSSALPAAFAQHAGAGYENVSREEMATPFLAVLQPLSPQCEAGGPEYVEGAKPGDIFNTVTKQLRNRVRVLVAHYERTFTEWVPRAKGGGFRGEHRGEAGLALYRACAVDGKEFGPHVTREGNDLKDTRNFYCFVRDEDSDAIEPVLISMTSTQIKVAKDWTAPVYIGKDRAPLQMFHWYLTTARKSNDKGTWHSWVLARGEPLDAERAEDVEIFKALLKIHRDALEAGGLAIDRSTEAEAPDAAPAPGAEDTY